MYEAALGLGIAAGPLVGGLLGDISWRGPFFGVAVLMAIALLATVILLDPTPKPARPTSIVAPLKALRHRSLLTMSLTAVLYNWGFFTMLGYAPYPMELSAVKLGFVFFAWGLLLAFFSITGAPWLQRRFGTAPSMYGALTVFAMLLLLIGVLTDNRWAVIVCVVASGIVAGINNTLTTQAVMLVAPVERPVASAAYGFVRFIGGGLAPYFAGKMVDHWNMHVPFVVGAVAVLAGVGILSTGHRMLARADAAMGAGGHGQPDEVAGEIADEFGGAPDAIDFEKEATGR
jgi:MFS transporter, ACDE family, multidrug resistance protein